MKDLKTSKINYIKNTHKLIEKIEDLEEERDVVLDSLAYRPINKLLTDYTSVKQRGFLERDALLLARIKEVIDKNYDELISSLEMRLEELLEELGPDFSV